MVLDYNPGWFLVLIAIGIFFISLAILLGFQTAFSETIPRVENYKDCINKEIPPHICDMIFPPLKQQNV